MMSWLLEIGKGEAATSAFGTKIDAYPRLDLDWEFTWVPTNIQKRNLNETVLDSELQEV